MPISHVTYLRPPKTVVIIFCLTSVLLPGCRSVNTESHLLHSNSAQHTSTGPVVSLRSTPHRLLSAPASLQSTSLCSDPHRPAHSTQLAPQLAPAPPELQYCRSCASFVRRRSRAVPPCRAVPPLQRVSPGRVTLVPAPPPTRHRYKRAAGRPPISDARPDQRPIRGDRGVY